VIDTALDGVALAVLMLVLALAFVPPQD